MMTDSDDDNDDDVVVVADDDNQDSNDNIMKLPERGFSGHDQFVNSSFSHCLAVCTSDSCVL